MRDPLAPPRRIAVAAHPSIPEAVAEIDLVCQYLYDQGVPSMGCYSLKDPVFEDRVRAGEFDAVIALGGDGTMLRAGNLCAPVDIPVLGINLGHFGFLTEVRREEWRQLLPRLLAGDYKLEDHMMLFVEHYRGEDKMGHWHLLNEVVVCRGQFVRPIKLQALVDNSPLATFIADGLIAATPTGSTAYALAVGGPILPPELRNILIVAVAPHLSLDRAIILAEGAEVRINVFTSHEAVMSVDGHDPQTLLDGDWVRVAASKHKATFIRFHDPSYFYHNLTSYMEQNPTAGRI